MKPLRLIVSSSPLALTVDFKLKHLQKLLQRQHMTAVDLDSSHASSLIDKPSRSEASSSKSSWIDPVTRMKHHFLIKGQFGTGDIFRDGDPDEK